MASTTRSSSSIELILLEIGITSLYEGKQPAIDVICVHGLNSTPARCWKKDNVLWLKDLLPRETELANTRIATFGYNSKITSQKASNARIRDHAAHLLQDLSTWRHRREETQRPIVFICHSLGGIVVKRALVIAQQNSSYRAILESTTGIMFLGTPHKGSQLANLGQKLAKTAGVAFQAKPHLLKSLKEDSEQLQDLSEEFTNLHSLFQIVSCYEMKPTVFKKGPFRMTEIVVTESSAKLGIPEEILVGINTDHHDICKFSHANDPEYTKVKNRIIDLVNMAPDVVKGRLKSAAGFYIGSPSPPSSINEQWQHRGYQNRVLSVASGGRDNSTWHLPDRGANINTQTGNDGSALQTAAFYGHESLVRFLLDRGADVNHASETSGTALQTAAFYGHENIVRLLLDRGATANAKGGPYGTALHAATLQPHRLRIIQLLLDRGADVNAEGGIHGSVLQGAVLQPHSLEVVRLLLNRGADVNAQSGNTYTALHGAVLFCNYAVVQLLIERGADVNALAGDYGTVLQVAETYEMPDQEAIVKLLKEAGARG